MMSTTSDSRFAIHGDGTAIDTGNEFSSGDNDPDQINQERPKP